MSICISSFDSWYLVLISISVAEIDGLEKLLVHFTISMWNQIESCEVFSCDFNSRVSARINSIPFVPLRRRFDLSIINVINLRYEI